MSLAINPDKVSSVLLADGWHQVEDKSFYIDSYEIVDESGFVYHGGGRYGVCASGFAFVENLDKDIGLADKVRVSGPLTAVLAMIER